jgi:hypothetical protein
MRLNKFLTNNSILFTAVLLNAEHAGSEVPETGLILGRAGEGRIPGGSVGDP